MPRTIHMSRSPSTGTVGGVSVDTHALRLRRGSFALIESWIGFSFITSLIGTNLVSTRHPPRPTAAPDRTHSPGVVESPPLSVECLAVGLVLAQHLVIFFLA